MINRALKIDDKRYLPHHRERSEPIKYIIIHCSKGNTEQQLETLNKLGLSAHYIIDIKGKLTEVVPPELVAYHAGMSHWKDSTRESLNETSIGIEVQSLDMGQTKGSYTSASTGKLCTLLAHLIQKYKIRRENILGHSDIAPTRKPDPGAGFPWRKLYRNDVLFWYNRATRLKIKDEKTLLEIIGYDTKVIEATRYAFCRRFMPEEVTVVENIQELVNNPYPKDFKPRNWEKYIQLLQAVAAGFEKERKRDYWYLHTTK